MSTVRFGHRYDWAILPSKQRVDVQSAKDEAETYAKSFRWARAYRRPELCWPWRLGQELGWVVHSPVRVVMTPLVDDEVEMMSGDPEAITALSVATGYSELWAREKSFLATQRNTWLRLHQFWAHDHWECMFVPNGMGSVEWHLGWTAQIPSGMYLLFLPHDPTLPVEVPFGVLSDDVVGRLSAGHGLSLAIRPRAPVEIRRGQPIARVLLLDGATIKARTEETE